MNINELINEAKKRYKVGDRFRVVHDPIEICTIESFDLHDDTIITNPDGSWHFNLLITDVESADSATVCHNGEWAEKVEPEKTPELLKANTGKFKVGDKVKVTRKCRSYEGDWNTMWSSEMDECVNGTYKITNELSGSGYRLDCGYWFPEFVLEKAITKYLADEFQVLKLEPYEDEQPTSPKGKLFDSLEEANAYHESLKPNTYTVELPEGYEVKREYVVLGSNTVDGIYLKLKRI